MTLHVGTASGNKTVTALHVGTSSGTKAVSEGWVGTASGNKQFYSSASTLLATAAPGSLSWFGGGGSYYSSDVAYCSPSGGTAPYTYQWSIDNGSASIDSPTSQSTGFTSTDGLPANATCTVTDADGNTAETNAVGLT